MSVLRNQPAGVCLAVFLLGLAPARAIDLPPEESTLVYSIERKGDEIGRHQVDYSVQAGGETDIDISAKIRVKFAFFTVYRLDHSGHELWEEGQLQRMTTTTLKNDDRDRVVVRANDGHFVVETEDGEQTAPLDLVPSSFTKVDFWIDEGSKDFLLLNTLSGDIRPSRLDYKGRQQVTLDGQAFDTRLYLVYDLEKGAVSHEFWVDDAGYLVRADLVTKDGHAISYRKADLPHG